MSITISWVTLVCTVVQDFGTGAKLMLSFRHHARTSREPAGQLTNCLRLLCLSAAAMACGQASIPAAFAQQTHPFNDPTAACYSSDGKTVVCAGDLSEGVLIDNVTEGTSYDRLELFANATMMPAGGVDGIYVQADSDFTVRALAVIDAAAAHGIRVSGSRSVAVEFISAIAAA
ncbi:MAG: hypothetical protein OEM91_07065, partial [Hyphomicrobiales bacterium]|nr:hypothetical protein [Hyphomicrobiales bacterium]